MRPALLHLVVVLSVLPLSAAAGAPVVFEDATDAAGISAPHIPGSGYFATGQAWGDFDGDGRDDLYTTTTSGDNRLWRNLGDGSFELHDPDGVHALDEKINGGTTFVDYDGDGLLDLLVLARGRHTLLKGQPGGGFADVTDAAGLTREGEGESAAWADFDGDGHLDLYIVHWYFEGDESSPKTRDVLYRNNGDGTFTDVTDWLDDERTHGPGFAAVWFDYDNDGDVDLYVLNDKFFGNVLWRNDGPGCGGWCFTDVSVASGAHRPADAMGIAVGDYDNDGDLDAAFTGTNEIVLLQNRTAQGSPEFVEVTQSAGVAIDDGIGWGLAFADFDHDGWLDLYVNLGSAEVPGNRMYLNDGDGGFSDISAASGADDPGYSTGLAVGDYDDDGDLDFVIGNLGDSYRLYANRRDPDGTDGWLRVNLEGPAGGFSSAAGTRVRLVTDDGREQIREAHIGSGLGGNHAFGLHFGLGSARPERLEIRWPDGREQVVEDPDSGPVTISAAGSRVVFGDRFEP